MRKELFRQQVVRLEHRVNVILMDPNRNTHQHVLRAFRNPPINLQEIRPLQRLESKVVVAKVAIINDGRVQHVLVSLDTVKRLFTQHGRRLARLWVDVRVEICRDLGKHLFRLLVEVGDG
jgi:hypothetical protein